MINMMMMVVLI